MQIRPTAIDSALGGLVGAQRGFDVDAEQIAPDAQSEQGSAGAGPEQLVDALVVQPTVYSANARVLRSADAVSGTLLDTYA